MRRLATAEPRRGRRRRRPPRGRRGAPRRHLPLRRARSRRSDADAEDLAQTAVVRALAAGASLRTPERAKWYLMRIVRNLATDQARARAGCRSSRGPTSPTSASADLEPEALVLPRRRARAPARRVRRPRTAATGRCCGCASSRSSTTTPSPSGSTPPSTRRANASTARCRRSRAITQRPPTRTRRLDPTALADLAPTRPAISTVERRQNGAQASSRRAGRARPSPPRGGGGGRGHGPRSGAPAPG